jgi:hypothetical protein
MSSVRWRWTATTVRDARRRRDGGAGMARGATQSDGRDGARARHGREATMEGILRALSGAKAQSNARRGGENDGFAANLRAQLPALMTVLNPSNGARARRRERASNAVTG